MTTTKFWAALFMHISIPFDISQVKEINTAAGTTWIDMNDGSSYKVNIEPVVITNRA